MKLSEEPVLVFLSSIVGLNPNKYEAPPSLSLKHNEEEESKTSLFKPPLIKVSGSFLSVLISIFHYILNPYFQYRTGPLQPKDELIFHALAEECCFLLNQIAQKVELAISKVKERKQKENLTTRPI